MQVLKKKSKFLVYTSLLLVSAFIVTIFFNAYSSAFNTEVEENLKKYEKVKASIDNKKVSKSNPTFSNIITTGYITLTWDDLGNNWCSPKAGKCISDKNSLLDVYKDNEAVKQCAGRTDNFYCCIPSADRGFFEHVKCEGQAIKDGKVYSSRFIKETEADSSVLPSEFSNGLTKYNSNPVVMRTVAVNPNANLNCYIRPWEKLYLYFGENNPWNGLYMAEDYYNSNSDDCVLKVFLGIGMNDYNKNINQISGPDNKNPLVFVIDSEGNVVDATKYYTGADSSTSSSLQGNIQSIYSGKKEVQNIYSLIEGTKEFADKALNTCTVEKYENSKDRMQCVDDLVKNNNFNGVGIVKDCIDPEDADYEKMYAMKKFSSKLADCTTHVGGECLCGVPIESDILGVSFSGEYISYEDVVKGKFVENSFKVFAQDISKTTGIFAAPETSFTIPTPSNRMFFFKKTKENNFILIGSMNEKLPVCKPESVHQMFCSYLEEDKRDVQKYLISFSKIRNPLPEKVIFFGDSTIDSSIVTKIADGLSHDVAINIKQYSSCTLEKISKCIIEGYDSKSVDCKHMCGSFSSVEVAEYNIDDYDTVVLFMTMNELFEKNSNELKNTITDTAVFLKSSSKNVVLVTNWPWKGPTGSYTDSYIKAKEEVNAWILSEANTDYVDVSLDIYTPLESSTTNGEINPNYFDVPGKKLNEEAKKVIADLLINETFSYSSRIFQKIAENDGQKVYSKNIWIIGDDVVRDAQDNNYGFMKKVLDQKQGIQVFYSGFSGCDAEFILSCATGKKSANQCKKDCSSNGLTVDLVDYESNKIDTIIVNVGINDLMKGKKANNIKPVLDGFIDFFNRKGINVIFMSISPWGSFQGYQGHDDYKSTPDKQVETLELNNYISSLNKPDSGIYAIDIFRKLEEPGTKNLRALYDDGLKDGLHFGEKGHELVAEIFMEFMFYKKVDSRQNGQVGQIIGSGGNGVQITVPSTLTRDKAAKFESTAKRLFNTKFSDGSSAYDYAVAAARREGIPEAIYLGLITQESWEGRDDRLNECGAVGLTQVVASRHYNVIRDTCGMDFVSECSSFSQGCSLSTGSTCAESTPNCDPNKRVGIARCQFTKYSQDIKCQLDVGARVLAQYYSDKQKYYKCTGRVYTGWEYALRSYNGWGGVCGSPNVDSTYVEKIMDYADAWGYAGVPVNQLYSVKLPTTLREPMIMRFVLKI